MTSTRAIWLESYKVFNSIYFVVYVSADAMSVISSTASRPSANSINDSHGVGKRWAVINLENI